MALERLTRSTSWSWQVHTAELDSEESRVPVFWERPANHAGEGGHVAYLDGRVAWTWYPGKFPMTEAFITRCEEISALKEAD